MLETTLSAGCISTINVPVWNRIRRIKVERVQYQLFHFTSIAKGFVASINSLPVLTNKNLRSDKKTESVFHRTNITIILNYKMVNPGVYASSAYETKAMFRVADVFVPQVYAYVVPKFLLQMSKPDLRKALQRKDHNNPDGLVLRLY